MGWWGGWGREQQRQRCRLESSGVFLVELQTPDRHLQTSAHQNLPSYVQVYVWPYERIMPGHHSECLHLFQFSMQTSPLNAFHSALLPGAGGHAITWVLGKGERAEGKLLPNLALFFCISQVEKDIISMSCSFHAPSAFPFFCLVFWMNQVQILS